MLPDIGLRRRRSAHRPFSQSEFERRPAGEGQTLVAIRSTVALPVRCPNPGSALQAERTLDTGYACTHWRLYRHCKQHQTQRPAGSLGPVTTLQAEQLHGACVSPASRAATSVSICSASRTDTDQRWGPSSIDRAASGQPYGQFQFSEQLDRLDPTLSTVRASPFDTSSRFKIIRVGSFRPVSPCHPGKPVQHIMKPDLGFPHRPSKPVRHIKPIFHNPESYVLTTPHRLGKPNRRLVETGTIQVYVVTAGVSLGQARSTT